MAIESRGLDFPLRKKINNYAKFFYRPDLKYVLHYNFRKLFSSSRALQTLIHSSHLPVAFRFAR